MVIVRLPIYNFYLRNVLAYCAILLLGVLVVLGESRELNFRNVLPTFIWGTFIFFLAFFHNRVLLDKILLKGRVLFYALSVVGLYFLYYYGTMAISSYTFKLLDARTFFLFVCQMLLGVTLFLSTRYLLERKQYYQTKILQRDVELQQLRSQLNPHFLFNALNNIYSYNLYNNSFGNDLILKLSNLMRFILDNSEKDSVPLKDEIAFIENYIAFERERLGERCLIVYDKNVLHDDREIAPLILFPFVENAFKHGTNTIQKTTVEISLSDASNELRLMVKNNIVKKDQPSTKKGLVNAKRRLEILYPTSHDFHLKVSDEMYIMNLTLRYEEDKSANSR